MRRTRLEGITGTMTASRDILCIGSVLWDVIGRAPCHMRLGADVAGRITRLPGGVALNIAMTLTRFGLRPVLLSAVGRDAQGDALVAACRALGMEVDLLYRAHGMPTDRYMAIEGTNGLIAAIADAHTLEKAGAEILAPLMDGRLGSAASPFAGIVALDGNLTTELLEEIAASPCFNNADLRVAPASPGKAERLLPFLNHRRAVLYVNCEEAGVLCQTSFSGAPEAAQGMMARGAARVLVTDGARAVAQGGPEGVIEARPPEVRETRVTGAGDTFMASHMAAEARGANPAEALESALAAAAAYVSGEPVE